MKTPRGIETADIVTNTAAQIELSIVTGELRPGQKVSEPALAARFGVSRGALREAMRALEGRRLLTRRLNAGVRVVDLSPDEVSQLLHMREALEGIAARQAAENMTLPELRTLKSIAEALREGLAEGVESLYRGGTEDMFHRHILRASRNRFIEDAVCRDTFPLLRIIRFRTTSVPARRKTIGDEHDAIVEAIERRLPEDAERLMRQHIANGRDSLLENFVEEPVLLRLRMNEPTFGNS